MAFELILGIIISTLTIQIVIIAIFGSTFGASLVLLSSSTTILMSIFLLLGIICHIKQRS